MPYFSGPAKLTSGHGAPFVEWAGNAQHCVPVLGRTLKTAIGSEQTKSRSIFRHFDTDNRSCHLILRMKLFPLLF